MCSGWLCLCVCVHTQSCPTLGNCIDYSPPWIITHQLYNNSVHRIVPARILEWVAISSSRVSSRPRDWTHFSSIFCIAGGFFYHWETWETPMFVTGIYPEMRWQAATLVHCLLASAVKGQRSPFPGIVLHGQPHWPSTSTCNMGPGILQQSWRAGSAPEESTQKLWRGSSWRKAGWDWIGCCLSPRLRWNNAGWSTPRPSPPTHGLAPALLGNWDTLQSWC